MSQETDDSSNTYWLHNELLPDERTKGWPLVDSSISIVLIVLVYLMMVWWLPMLMEKRKAFKLQRLLIVYNFLMVLLNAHILKEVIIGTSRLHSGYLCHPSKVDYHPDAMRVINASWLYFISKIIDFLDTLFFILRKKNTQLSVLHVFHHSTVVPYSWIFVKLLPIGNASQVQIVNTFVHVIMYTYYGLSAMGPHLQKYLWWKKYLTIIQLVQFCMVISISLYSLVRKCNYPALLAIFNILYMCSFIVLFGKFYKKKYK